MEIEKRSSKGGFLQLFDWNLKSRKKLFSSKSELPDNTKRGFHDLESSAIPPLQQAHEYRLHETTRGLYDYHYASSVNSDEGYGTRAPGVVARLMGLDSLPTSNDFEPLQMATFETHPCRDSYYFRSATDFQSEHQMPIHENMRNKLDGFTKNPLDSKLKKVQTRPIERFQTEMLPPKSAKPISITHHRMLSPIKSPGFIPAKSAAYIMEAAAKIIDQSPRPSSQGKLPSIASSSVPLQIRELREKMEAAQRSRITVAAQKAREQTSTKILKKQSSEDGESASEKMPLFKDSEISRRAGAQQLRGKEKSVSLAVQARTNVQKRGSFNSMDNRSSLKQNEQGQAPRSFVRGNNSNSQKSMGKRLSGTRHADVLRQNNQKQNSATDKDRKTFKSSASLPNKKPLPSQDELARSKMTMNKGVMNNTVGSKQSSFMPTDSVKETPQARPKTFSGKKKQVNKDTASSQNVSNGMSTGDDERSVRCNITIDRLGDWAAVDRKTSMDVVSFTFTSPIKKSTGSRIPEHVAEMNKYGFPQNISGNQSESINSSLSSLGLNVIGGDALSMLLEQKLKELTSKVDLPGHQMEAESLSSPVGSLQDSLPTFNAIHTAKQGKRLNHSLNGDKSKHDTECSSAEEFHRQLPVNGQGSAEVEEDCISSSTEYSRDFNGQYSSPLSSLEPSVSDGSCSSTLDSDRSLISSGNKLHRTSGTMIWNFSSKNSPLELDLELIDSASTTSIGPLSSDDFSTNSKGHPNWELIYIKDILKNADLLLMEFVLGQAEMIISPELFHHLEAQIAGSGRIMEEMSKLERKALFDSVEECLQLRCQQLFCGSFQVWFKWKLRIEKEERFAEELYKEISGWTRMEEAMVDELVEVDMSTKYGKWVNFDIEAFEEGVDIEREILTSLVDELIDDLLLT